MTRTLRVLHLEDQLADAALIRDRLELDGVLCDIRLTHGRDDYERALAEGAFDLIISDYNVPGYDGISALKRAQAVQPHVPVILVSGTIGESEAVKCLQFGAADYLLKGQLDRLAPAVHRAIEEALTRVTRARVEAALAQSERRKAAILDSVLDCIFTMDAEGVVLEFNSAAERTFGYSRIDAIGRRLDELIIPPAFRQAHNDLIARYLETGAADLLGKIVEMSAMRSDGSVLPVELTITAIHTEHPPIFTGVMRDITSRKNAEAEVRDERDRAQRYLDTAEVILLALDLTGRITLANRYACALLGWRPEELQGRDWVETCVPKRVRPERRSAFLSLLAGNVSPSEALVLTRDGRERLIEWRDTLQRDERGRVIGTFGSGTDITERSRAVAALQTADERMRFALQSANVGIWDWDCATGAVRWSEIVEGQYGLPPGTFGGTLDAFAGAVHPDDRTSLLDTLREAARIGADFSISHRSRWPDGTVHWLSGAGRVVLDGDGHPLRGVGISQDVSARHQLEQQSRQTQKMEAVGQLAGGVAHDFNNLLTVILGYCEMMLDDLGGDHACHDGLVQIHKAGESAARLTRQLLAFSRKEIISPTLLDVNVVVTAMRVMLQRLIREDVRIELTTSPEAALVMADRGQLEQIVVNLSVNARDAMPKGGTLSIQIATTVLDERCTQKHPEVVPGPYVSLTVTDTGTGIPPETEARLFEPFFTTKEAGRGTGLGLATVHGIVTQNGGCIEVSSAVGAGATFCVYFPQAQPTGATIVAPPAGAGTLRGSETILIVEDEDGLRLLITSLLERLGYTVLVASNASDAIETFARHANVDLLLTDVVMPGGSGSDLSTWLIQGQPDLKVLYMSGYTDETIVHHGVLDPGIAFLHKPFTAEALGLKVREVLDAQPSG